MDERERLNNEKCVSRRSELAKRESNLSEFDRLAAKSSGRGKTKCVAGLNGLFRIEPSSVIRMAQTRAR